MVLLIGLLSCETANQNEETAIPVEHKTTLAPQLTIRTSRPRNTKVSISAKQEELTTTQAVLEPIHAGDLMLYDSDCLELFYDSFSTSYRYTSLGKVKNPLGLKSIIGNGSVDIQFSVIKQDLPLFFCSVILPHKNNSKDIKQIYYLLYW